MPGKLTRGNPNWFHTIFARFLKQGPLPAHVGFILDGNRRWAEGNKVGKRKGHEKGLNTATTVFDWCVYMGIEEITLYAFSIENFKRSSQEVQDLMDIFRNAALDLLENPNEYRMRVEVVGDWAFLPADLKPLIARAMTVTKNNTEGKLNLAFAYTGRNEITRGIRALVKGFQDKDLELTDLDEELLEQTFTIHPSRKLDLLVRTSAECRLSDFLLWQCKDVPLWFPSVNWPDFSAWHLVRAVFFYQTNYFALQKLLPKTHEKLSGSNEGRKQQFIEKFRNKQWDILAGWQKCTQFD